MTTVGHLQVDHPQVDHPLVDHLLVDHLLVDHPQDHPQVDHPQVDHSQMDYQIGTEWLVTDLNVEVPVNSRTVCPFASDESLLQKCLIATPELFLQCHFEPLIQSSRYFEYDYETSCQ